MSARSTRKSCLALLWAVLAACGRVETRKVEQAGEASCPGVAFAVGCGDRTCDARAGEDPVSCPADCTDATVRSYNQQTLCERVAALVEPASVPELQAVIRRARAEQRPVRVIGRRHTSNAQLCSDGYVVSTAKLGQALHIERFEGVETVVTEPGIRLGDLNDWLDARGRSLGFAVLGTRDPTIAGAIATGSHGSSPRHSDVLSNLVQSIDLVGADGELHEYSRGRTPPAVWKTLTASLGLAGVMTRLRLRIEPSFNLGVEVTYHGDFELGRGAGLSTTCASATTASSTGFPASIGSSRPAGSAPSCRARWAPPIACSRPTSRPGSAARPSAPCSTGAAAPPSTAACSSACACASSSPPRRSSARCTSTARTAASTSWSAAAPA